MKKINIAIDGYAGCGKSTTAKLVAQKLHYLFVDSGSMYRAVTLYFIQNQVDITNLEQVKKALLDIHIVFKNNAQTHQREIYLNGICVEKEIRSLEVSNYVSEVSALKEVRVNMVKQQQRMGLHKGVVMDGRDIGTVVFPDAELKIFMTATLDARVQRRKLEFAEKGQSYSAAVLRENLLSRDEIDTTRQESPLRQAQDAYVLDTTSLSIDEQVNWVIEKAQHIMGSLESAQARQDIIRQEQSVI
ncbi:MAG: (d)CMP kinase [Bacteroidia bacterium]|nr:(d)CMP kinase [Bacteroidia bacterium]